MANKIKWFQEYRVSTRQMEAQLADKNLKADKFQKQTEIWKETNLNRSKMTDSEVMQAAIMQVAVQAATVAVRVMREADQPAELHIRRSISEKHCRPRQARPIMSQPVFSWKALDRYVELLNFEMEAANVLQAKVYDLSDEGKVPIIKIWFSREGLQFIQTLTNAEKEACKSVTWAV